MNEIILKALENINVDKLVGEQLEAQLKKAIGDSIKGMFGYGGVVKEVIEKKIKDELNVNLSHINFQDYTVIISKQIEDTIYDVIKNQVGDRTRHVLMAHEHIKPNQSLKNMIEKYIQQENDDFEGEEGVLSVKIKHDNWLLRTTTIQGGYPDDFKITITESGKQIVGLDVDHREEAPDFYNDLKKIQQLSLPILIEDELDGKKYEIKGDED